LHTPRVPRVRRDALHRGEESEFPAQPARSPENVSFGAPASGMNASRVGPRLIEARVRTKSRIRGEGEESRET